MDIETYVLLKKRLDNVTLAYDYKGSVSSVDDLPESAETGDLYTVAGIQYVYDGSAWTIIQTYVPPIAESDIDELFDE